MKWNVSTVMTIVLLLCGAAANANMLVNGDFEGDWEVFATYDAHPDNWGVSSGWCGKYQLPTSGHDIGGNKAPHSGDYAWELATLSGGIAVVYGSQTVTVATAGDYVLSGWVKTNHNTTVVEVRAGVDDDMRWLTNVTANIADYTYFEQTFTLSPGAHTVKFGLDGSTASNPAYVYSHWDDISLVPEPASVTLLILGGAVAILRRRRA